MTEATTDGRSGSAGEATREAPAWRSLLPAALVLVALLGTAWLVRIDRPRELPFPALDPRAPFPELAAQPTAPAADTPGDSGPSGASRFAETLRRRALSAPLAAASLPGQPSGTTPTASIQTLPLGGGLVADLPSRAWRWSSVGWATLAVQVPSGDRPTALLYAEPFSPAYAVRPTVELLRFRWTALPLSADDLSPLGGLRRADRLLATATAGRGLGFSAAEDGFSGIRWVGRNDHRVILRLGRFDGSWDGRVGAYLLLGSAAAPGEALGAHLAVLCARSPDCPAAEELAGFLASIRQEDPSGIDRLRQGAQGSFEDLATTAGLELDEPRLEPVRAPTP